MQEEEVQGKSDNSLFICSFYFVVFVININFVLNHTTGGNNSTYNSLNKPQNCNIGKEFIEGITFIFN